MVTLPAPFVAIQFPGYFWNTENKLLYSLKVSGELKPLKRNKPTHFNQHFAGYTISVKGRPKYIQYADLIDLQLLDSVIPYAAEQTRTAQVTVHSSLYAAVPTSSWAHRHTNH